MSSASISSAEHLEPFCVLARSTTGEGVTYIIKQVLRHADIFVFGELLDCPSVQALQDTQHQPWLMLLRLFAYGTYQDYKSSSSSNSSNTNTASSNPLLSAAAAASASASPVTSWPELSATEIRKLKQLSAVSLAGAASNKMLSYATLSAALELSTVSEIEALLIECFDQRLLAGKLDQKLAQLEVSYAMGRDLGPSDLHHMQGIIASWSENTLSLLEVLQTQMSQARDAQDRSLALSMTRSDRVKDVNIILSAHKPGANKELSQEGAHLAANDREMKAAVSIIKAANDSLNSPFHLESGEREERFRPSKESKSRKGMHSNFRSMMNF